VDTSLVNYINQLLQSGYNINAIRNQLVSSGYDINTVNEAINYVYQGSGEQAPKTSFLTHLKSKKFIVAFSGILLLIILSFIIMTFAGGESLPIEIFATPLSSQVTAGEDLTFTKSVLNVEGTGMLSLSYSITSPSGEEITSSLEKVSAQSVPRGSTLAIPSDTPEGSYQLKATANFGEQQSEVEFSFTVVAVQEEPEETPREYETPPPGSVEEPDNDEDGIPDSTDLDDDNDGIPDVDDLNPVDHDNDGTVDSSDTDDDGDGILDKYDYYLFDRDNDGISDEEDTDNDNDGIEDEEDEYVFDYDNDGLDDAEDDDKSFEVPPEQSSGGISFACTANFDCNDYDVCSVDSCVEGTCEYESVSPCCGNFVCETGEDSSGCPQDCQGTVLTSSSVGGDDVIEDIIADAASNPEAAAVQCDEIEKESVADQCYFELAKASSNSAFCDLVIGEKTKDSCFMYFVINLDEFNHCDNVANRYLRNSCYSIEVASTSPTS